MCKQNIHEKLTNQVSKSTILGNKCPWTDHLLQLIMYTVSPFRTCSRLPIGVNEIEIILPFHVYKLYGTIVVLANVTTYQNAAEDIVVMVTRHSHSEYCRNIPYSIRNVEITFKISLLITKI